MGLDPWKAFQPNAPNSVGLICSLCVPYMTGQEKGGGGGGLKERPFLGCVLPLQVYTCGSSHP